VTSTPRTVRLLAGWTIHPSQRDGQRGVSRQAATRFAAAQRPPGSGNPSPRSGMAIHPVARQSLATPHLNGTGCRPVNPARSARQPSPLMVKDFTITNPLAKVSALRVSPCATCRRQAKPLCGRGEEIPFEPREEMIASPDAISAASAAKHQEEPHHHVD
jgi:hypothetical protein